MSNWNGADYKNLGSLFIIFIFLWDINFPPWTMHMILHTNFSCGFWSIFFLINICIVFPRIVSEKPVSLCLRWLEADSLFFSVVLTLAALIVTAAGFSITYYSWHVLGHMGIYYIILLLHTENGELLNIQIQNSWSLNVKKCMTCLYPQVFYSKLYKEKIIVLMSYFFE